MHNSVSSSRQATSYPTCYEGVVSRFVKIDAFLLVTTEVVLPGRLYLHRNKWGLSQLGAHFSKGSGRQPILRIRARDTRHKGHCDKNAVLLFTGSHTRVARFQKLGLFKSGLVCTS